MACGIIGIKNNPKAAELAYLGLYALQHRGQESVGVVSTDGAEFYEAKDMSLVFDVIKKGYAKITQLAGDTAIGHVRYSTAGSKKDNINNVQPLYFNDLNIGDFYIAHNGNLTNFKEIKTKLQSCGANFWTETDTEIIGHLFTRAVGSLEEKLIGSLKELNGAYSLIMLTKDSLIGIRDPRGFRPLCLGRFGESYILASETSVFNTFNLYTLNHSCKEKIAYGRDLDPGEIVLIKNDCIKSTHLPDKKHAFCIFELVYFARPDSIVFGRPVWPVRENLGRTIARKFKLDADFVTSVPDSGTPGTIGYCLESRMPFKPVIFRDHYYSKRTFIDPTQAMRDLGAELKYFPIPSEIAGKRIVVVDDSHVRGTTSKRIANYLKYFGAKWVALLFTFPPHAYSCFYGIDTPTNEELPGHSKTTDELSGELKQYGADYVGFLTIDEVVEATGLPKSEFCLACSTGEYPC